jgi:hypothetical protein
MSLETKRELVVASFEVASVTNEPRDCFHLEGVHQVIKVDTSLETLTAFPRCPLPAADAQFSRSTCRVVSPLDAKRPVGFFTPFSFRL